MYHKVTLILLFILVLIVLHSTWRVYLKKRESEEMKNVSLTHVEELRQRDKILKSEIERLATEKGVEEEIRSKFSVAREEEALVVIVSEENNATSTTKAKQGFWSKFKSFFR